MGTPFLRKVMDNSSWIPGAQAASILICFFPLMLRVFNRRRAIFEGATFRAAGQVAVVGAGRHSVAFLARLDGVAAEVVVKLLFFEAGNVERPRGREAPGCLRWLCPRRAYGNAPLWPRACVLRP